MGSLRPLCFGGLFFVPFGSRFFANKHPCLTERQGVLSPALQLMCS